MQVFLTFYIFIYFYRCQVNSDSEVRDAISVIRNYQPTYGSFKFRSFTWTSNMQQEIYIFCEVRVCEIYMGMQCENLVTLILLYNF